MKQVMWTLYDCETKIFEPPMTFRNDVVAQTYFQRTIKQAIESGKLAGQPMQMFTFRKVAEFDDETAEFNFDFKPMSLKIDGEGAFDYV